MIAGEDRMIWGNGKTCMGQCNSSNERRICAGQYTRARLSCDSRLLIWESLVLSKTDRFSCVVHKNWTFENWKNCLVSRHIIPTNGYWTHVWHQLPESMDLSYLVSAIQADGGCVLDWGSVLVAGIEFLNICGMSFGCLGISEHHCGPGQPIYCMCIAFTDQTHVRCNSGIWKTDLPPANIIKFKGPSLQLLITVEQYQYLIIPMLQQIEAVLKARGKSTLFFFFW